MNPSRTLIWLSSLVAVLALISSAAGLFWTGGGESFPFTTLHGEQVEIYGRGLYRYDWAFKAPILRGTDAIILFLAIPVLIVAILLAFSTFDLETLPAQVSPHLPRRGFAVFVFLAGLSAGVWLIDLIPAALTGAPPSNLAGYTTDATAVIDVGVILPSAFLAGVLLLRRRSLGYPLTATLLTLLSLIGLIVAGQTVMQVLDGIHLEPGEIAVFVVPFVALSLIADGLLVVFLRHVSEPKTRSRRSV